MRIAVDYDGTFTTDPELWRAFVKEAAYRGHDVAIVTGRIAEDTEGVQAEADHLGIPVVYTEGEQKQDVYGADIWIDDRPDHVVGHHQVRILLEQGYINLNKS